MSFYILSRIVFLTYFTKPHLTSTKLTKPHLTSPNLSQVHSNKFKHTRKIAALRAAFF